jgi:hypothetical protein
MSPSIVLCSMDHGSEKERESVICDAFFRTDSLSSHYRLQLTRCIVFLKEFCQFVGEVGLHALQFCSFLRNLGNFSLKIRCCLLWTLPWDMGDKSTSPLRTSLGLVLNDFVVQRGLHFPE